MKLQLKIEETLSLKYKVNPTCDGCLKGNSNVSVTLCNIFATALQQLPGGNKKMKTTGV